MPALPTRWHAYGRTWQLDAPAEHLAEVLAHLPPGARPAPTRTPERVFTWAAGGEDAWLPALRFAKEIELWVAERARDRVFVHAGVVVVAGRAVLLPGPSFRGKSRLVEALVRAGATYYSDEYAVLDPRGLVRPYPRRIGRRADDGSRTEWLDPADLGGPVGGGPVPVGVVVELEWTGGAGPPVMTALSQGEGALGLVANAVAARSRPRAVLTAVAAVVEVAPYLRGTRGEAGPAADVIVKTLQSDQTGKVPLENIDHR